MKQQQVAPCSAHRIMQNDGRSHASGLLNGFLCRSAGTWEHTPETQREREEDAVIFARALERGWSNEPEIRQKSNALLITNTPPV